MRTKLSVMMAALLLVTAGAKAQDVSGSDPQRDVPKSTVPAAGSEFPGVNQIDIGLRGTVFGSNSDEARFQRYRDLRDGGTLDLFRFTKETKEYKFNLAADHLGYRDQRYSATFNDFGKVKATFEFNQIPLNYSNTTQSLYTSSAPGVLVLSDGIQSGIQNKTLTLGSAMTGASVFDLQSKRSVADFRLNYSATDRVDFGLTMKNTLREGSQPYGATYGFSNDLEVPLPVDNRTTEMGAALQWSNDRGMAKVAYDGSFFRNNVSTLTWDNPWRVSDAAVGGPALGRMALAPDTDMNTGSAMGSIKLPGRSRATAFLSIANLTNNTSLIPFTTNTALPTIPLARPTADLTARVTSMNYNFTSSPTSILWFSARYRGYEYDNRSPEFYVGQTINYDTAVATLNSAAERIGFTRKTFDGDMAVSPFRYVSFRGGYTRESIDHGNPSNGEVTRFIEQSTEDTGRFSMDLTNVGWLTLRGVFEHSKRVGTAPDPLEMLSIGEQPTLRQFDIADRNKDSFRGIVQVMPTSVFSVNASAGIGKEDYPGAYFGLRNNDNHVYSVGFDYVPIDAISAGVSYGYEKYTALQASRTANPLTANTLQYLNDPTQQFNDPRRDWTDDSADLVHTWNGSFDLLKVIPKTEVKLGYDYSKAQSTYVYGLAANTTLPAPVQLPAVVNTLQRGTADVKYFLTSHLAAGLVYWYDKYDVNDFALGPQSSLALPATASPTTMYLGYYFRPYSANTFWGRLTYLW
jgi:MtrB/PioB family decaheme-associated outer membrane protein